MKLQPAFTLQDVNRAEWGANCGPAALAVIAGLSLAELRPYLGDFEAKRYMNPSMMVESLKRLGLGFTQHRPPAWPKLGLVRIQWEGPWMRSEVPVRARYCHTHWVAAAKCDGATGVWDVNCMNNGTGWVSLEEWATVLVPWLVKECVPRGSGGWHLTHAIEVPRL